MNKMLILILMPSVFSAQQKFTYVSPLGSTTYQVQDNNLKFLNNTFDMSLGNFKLQDNKTNTLDSKNILFTGKKLTAYYKESKSKTYGNTIGLNYLNFNFSHDNYQTPTSIGIQTAKFLLINKTDYSYINKDFNFKFSDMNTYNQLVKEYSFQTKKINADFLSSQTKFTALDYWKNSIRTIYSLSMNYDKLSTKFMDKYQEYNFTNNVIGLKSINGAYQNEQDLSYSSKKLSFSESKYDYNNIRKNFFDIKSGIYEYQMAKDQKTISMLTTGNTITAYGNDQKYIQTKFKDLSFKYSDFNKNRDYDISYKYFGLRDGIITTNYEYKGVKTTFVGQELETITANENFKSYKVNAVYSNKFDIFDFYFNQKVFSVYDNSYKFLSRTSSVYKKTLAVNIINNKLAATSDLINNIFSVSYKNKNYTTSYTKNQKQDLINLSFNGNYSMEYNAQLRKIDKLTATYEFKF